MDNPAEKDDILNSKFNQKQSCLNRLAQGLKECIYRSKYYKNIQENTEVNTFLDEESERWNNSVIMINIELKWI